MPIATIQCVRCSGYSLECEKCGGVGTISVYRCPFATAPKELLAIIPFYSDWDKGRLPVPGGVLDQSNFFVEAMRYLDQCIARLQHEKDAQRERELELQCRRAIKS